MKRLCTAFCALVPVLTLVLTLALPALAQVSDLRGKATAPSTSDGLKPAPKAGKTATDYMREGRTPRPAVKTARPAAAAKTPASLQ